MSSVAVNGTKRVGVPGWSPVAPGFYDVVFHEGVPCPTVNTHIGVAVRLEINSVIYGNIPKLLISLSAIKLSALTEKAVIDVAPLAGEAAAAGDGHAGISPVFPEFVCVTVFFARLIVIERLIGGSGHRNQTCQAHSSRCCGAYEPFQKSTLHGHHTSLSVRTQHTLLAVSS